MRYVTPIDIDPAMEVFNHNARMRRRPLYFLLIAFAVVILVTGWWTISANISSPRDPVASLPMEFAGSSGWTQDQFAAVAQQLARQDQWSDPLLRYVDRQVFIERNSPLVRNLLATGLLRHAPDPAALAPRFIAAAHDLDADPVWRQYAVQFAAEAGGATMAHQLVPFLVGEPAIAATAAIHIHRIHNENRSAVPDGFDAMLAAWSADPARPLGARVTALALCRERGGSSALASAREGLRDPVPSIRRGAVAILARHGTIDDAEALRLACADTDAQVVRLAESALREVERAPLADDHGRGAL